MKKRILSLFVVVLPLLAVVFFWLISPKPVELKQVSFSDLPGWQQANLQPSLTAFKQSCSAFLRQRGDKKVGSKKFELTASAWKPLCQQAVKLENPDTATLKQFFESNFTVVKFEKNGEVDGLFTGYYMPLLHGSREKTEHYAYPLYATPKNKVSLDLADFDPSFGHRKLSGLVEGNTLKPMPERAQINQGVLKKSSDVLVWVDDRIERFFLEIQGSGVVELPDGSHMIIGYDSANGAPYKAIGSVLINQKGMSRDGLSMDRIRQYLLKHTDEMDEVLHQNKSFVFFRELKQKAALGSQGVPLTPGYSLAVDRKWIPLGMPMWLDTTYLDSDKKTKPLQRLMIAQDTGGAIKGMVRGDVFWGDTKQAEFIAGNMKNRGHYYLLIPKAQLTELLKATPIWS